MRCGMDLDEIDPARWALLDAATDKYIADEDAAFDACARLLVHNVVDHQRKPADIHSLALGAYTRLKWISLKLPLKLGSTATISKKSGLLDTL